MFDVLTKKITVVLTRFGSKGRLTEKEIESGLREIRMALLEADVNFQVARDLVTCIRTRVLSENVLQALSPGQKVVKITNEELTSILGKGTQKLIPAGVPPSVILIAGLNGSGKTTTAAKIAFHLKKSSQKPLLVAADLHRPAAIKQLETLGKQIDVEVYQESTSPSPIKVAKNGVKRAIELNASWVIIDTAGRFQVDDALMIELEQIMDGVVAAETLLVVDAMTGQEAVKIASEFNDRIGLTGVVLSKLDGDARGGAALSIASVTGVPIKFIGVGENVDAIEPFHPDRMASRILGMGDMLTLVEKAQNTFDQQKAEQLEEKIRRATFDLDDFLGQLQQLHKMGSVNQIIDMIPGLKNLSPKGSVEQGVSEKNIEKIESVIYSMTPEERRRPDIIGGSRRRRIAKGSGTTPQDVNQVLNQFRNTQKLMKQMTSAKGRNQLMNMMRR